MSGHLAVELLSSYLDSEVTPTELRLVEGHLDECSKCRRTVAGLRAVSEGVRRLEAVAPPASLARGVERRVARASLEQASGFGLEESLRRWAAQPVLAPVFAIVLALGAILYLFAFGVARDESRGTRLVIASAPEETPSDSLPEAGLADRIAKAGEVDAGSADRDDSRAVPELGRPDEAPSSPAPPVPVRLPTAAQPLPSSEADETGGTGGSDLENEPAEKTERMADEPFEARGAALRVGAARVAQPPAPAPAPADDRFDAVAASETVEGEAMREVAGRRFFADGQTWVEAGLEGAAVDEVVNWRRDADPEIIELEALRELGRIRVRIDERVVEVVYPESADSNR